MLNTHRYTPPHLPRIVHRRRLFRRLRDNNRRVTMVVGQAAQGKSTLVADYLSTQPDPVAWLHLDRETGDCAEFCNLLIHAVRHGLNAPVDWTDPLDTPKITANPELKSHQYGTRLLACLEQITRPMIIVLDAVETVPQEAAMHALMARFLAQAPVSMRFFLISRRVPPMHLQDLKVKRQALFIENTELEFNPREIKEYFNIFHGLALNSELAEKLYQISGGWTGGVVLISQALNRVPATGRLRFLTDHLPDDLSSETLAYFAEEVFEGQNDTVKKFLTRTAILDAVDPRMAADITGIEASPQILKALVEQNLFVQAVPDPVKGYCYRYNHLFREFLLNRFKTRIPGAERQALYRQPGVVYASRGDYSSAVGCALKTGDFDRAAGYVKKTGIDLFLDGRTHDLKRWLGALPQQMIQDDPLLLLLLTLTRRVVGGSRNIADFKRALEGFEAAGNLRGLILSLAYLIEAGIFVGHDPVRLRRWVERGEALLGKVSDIHYYTYAKTILWLQIGFACISGGIGVRKGLSACGNAHRLARKMGSRPLAANAGIITALGFTLAGEFQRAEACLKELEPLVGSDSYPEYNVLRQLIAIELRLHKGALENIETSLERVRADIDTFGLLFIYPAYVYTEGFLHIIKRRFETARNSFRHLWDVAALAGNEYYKGLAHRLDSLNLYHRGRYLQAQKAAEQAVGILVETAGDTLYLARMEQTLGMISLHRGDHEDALNTLQKVMVFFRDHNHPVSQAECHIGLGLTASGGGDNRTARAHLLDGFRIVSEYQYTQFIMLAPTDVGLACRLARDLGIEADIPPVFRVRKPEFHPAPRLETAPLHRNAGQQPQGGQIDIQTLGRFTVRLANGRAVADNGWSGARPKLLLKALLVHGGREVPKDILIDMLWPEVGPEAAGRNFKITLHRLRRVLQPDFAKGSGSQLLSLNNKLLSLDRGFCRIDVDLFLRCCMDAGRLENQSEPGRILGIGRKAAELYQGDFLPEEPYIAWAEMKRVALRNEYIRLMHRMADACVSLERHEKAARYMGMALTRDPGHEQSMQRLLELYNRLGRRSEAVRAFETFRQHLSDELGIAPDPKTEIMFQKLTNS